MERIKISQFERICKAASSLTKKENKLSIDKFKSEVYKIIAAKTPEHQERLIESLYKQL